jgi:hypothetical protein
MLLAHHNSFYAFKKADRDESKENFIVFAKAFSNVCLDACERSIGNE